MSVTHCDHGMLLTQDCDYCAIARRITRYSPPLRLHLGPESLGSCDFCGVDVPISDHLYKTPTGYLCSGCIEQVENCSK